MHKETKREKAQREMTERLKRAAQKDQSSLQAVSSPLLEQARQKLRPDFGLEEARKNKCSEERLVRGATSLGDAQTPVEVLQNSEMDLPNERTSAHGHEELVPPSLPNVAMDSSSDVQKSLLPEKFYEEYHQLAAVQSTVQQSTDERTDVSVKNEIQAANVLKSSDRIKAPEDVVQKKSRKIIRPKYVVQKPVWSADFSKDTSFISDWLFELIGARNAFTIRLYLQLYKRAKELNVISIRSHRDELLEMIGSGSSSTLTRAIQIGEQNGLFNFQSIPFFASPSETGSHFHLKFPWKNN